MEVKTEIGVEQLLSMVKQLPEKEITRLLNRIKIEVSARSKDSQLSELLKKAPTWSDKDMNAFEETRQGLNSWRTE